MKPKFLDLRGMKTRIRKASDYIVEIVSEAYPMSEEDKQELRETIETEVYDLLDEIRQRIKSACEFYLKFRNDPSVFFALYPQYYDDFEEKCGSLSDNLENTKCFNEWLFKLAFKGVLKDVK